MQRAKELWHKKEDKIAKVFSNSSFTIIKKQINKQDASLSDDTAQKMHGFDKRTEDRR